jgi:hypothetical protein
VGIYQLPRFFMVEVSALVRRLLVQLCHAFASLSAAARAFLFARECPLGSPKLLLSPALVARRFDRFAIRSNKETLEAEIYSNCRTISSRFGSFSDVADQDGIPLAARPITDLCADI